MKHLKLRTILKTITMQLVLVILGYFVAPILLSYPPHTDSISFQKKVENISHQEQYIYLFIIGVIITITVVLIIYRNIFKFVEGKSLKITMAELRQRIFSVPKKLIIMQLSVLVFVFAIVFVSSPTDIHLYIKFLLVYVTIFLSGVIMTLFWLDGDLKKTLVMTYEVDKKYVLDVKKQKFQKLTLLRIIPLTIIIMVVICLLNYTIVIEGTGYNNYMYYKTAFSNIEFEGLSDTKIKSELKQITPKNKEDYYFLMYSNENIYMSKKNKEISEFMKEYIKDFSSINDGRAYEYYGIEEEGYVVKIKNDIGQHIHVGYKYLKTEASSFYTFLILLGISIMAYFILIYFWVKNTASIITSISNNMADIVNEKQIDYDKKLPIITNDELGEITDSYNKIQDLTKKYIDEIQDKQDLLVKQAQLVTLGELAGGMAHDINTPISAVSYGISYLEKNVVDEKQKETIVNMKVCTEKIISIVNSMRDQIRNLGTRDIEFFEVEDVINNTNIMVSSVLVKAGCTLEIAINNHVKLYGEKNKLNQVITNMVMNCIQAYQLKQIKGKITIKLHQEENDCIIEIADMAGGIPENIREELFHKILTTKGTKGTGIGLYLAYSVIKGVFAGEIDFKTETDKGTTFYIKIPIRKEI